jgi:aminotransferase
MDFTNALNSKIRDVKPSGIRKFFDIVEEFEDVISLGTASLIFRLPSIYARQALRHLRRGRRNIPPIWVSLL